MVILASSVMEVLLGRLTRSLIGIFLLSNIVFISFVHPSTLQSLSFKHGMKCKLCLNITCTDPGFILCVLFFMPSYQGESGAVKERCVFLLEPAKYIINLWQRVYPVNWAWPCPVCEVPTCFLINLLPCGAAFHFGSTPLCRQTWI